MPARLPRLANAALVRLSVRGESPEPRAAAASRTFTRPPPPAAPPRSGIPRDVTLDWVLRDADATEQRRTLAARRLRCAQRLGAAHCCAQRSRSHLLWERVRLGVGLGALWSCFPVQSARHPRLTESALPPPTPRRHYFNPAQKIDYTSEMIIPSLQAAAVSRRHFICCGLTPGARSQE